MMKYFLFLSFLVLTIACCKKETSSDNFPNIPYFDFKIYFPGNQDLGNVTATVFDKEWNASATIVRDTFNNPLRYFQVYFETYSDEGFTRDQISFGVFEGKIGEYLVTDNPFDNQFDDFSIASKYGLWISDGDLLYGNYFIDATYNNKIIIDKNDGNTIEGRFWLLFTSSAGEHTDIPGRIFFNEGKFMVKL